MLRHESPHNLHNLARWHLKRTVLISCHETWQTVLARSHWPYSKEPKSVTAFELLTFFRADLIQSEASWKLSSTSDWLMSA